MTTPPTKYLTYNPNLPGMQDLSEIFEPLNGGTPPLPYLTGLRETTSNIDLANIFLPLTANPGSMINYPTKYTTGNPPKDLQTVFSGLVVTPSTFTTTGNPTITYSTNYIVVQYNNTTPGANSITFMSANQVPVNYLVVGGGGSGGLGTGVFPGPALNTKIYGGGGGASGDIIQSSTPQNVAPNIQTNISVGQGGINTGSSNPGNSSSITFPQQTITAGGGAEGTDGSASQTMAAAGGISSYGSGGDGLYLNNGTQVSSGSAATGYSNAYSNITLSDGYSLGTFGGGGGGAGRIDTFHGWPGQGTGGVGGFLYNNNTNADAPTAGTLGGGGGGGFPDINTTPIPPVVYGASGGDGTVILWFSKNF